MSEHEEEQDDRKQQLHAIKNIERMAFKIKPLTAITLLTTVLLAAQLWFKRDNNSKLDYVRVQSTIEMRDSSWAHALKEVIIEFRRSSKLQNDRDSVRELLLMQADNKHFWLIEQEIKGIRFKRPSQAGLVTEHRDSSGRITFQRLNANK